MATIIIGLVIGYDVRLTKTAVRSRVQPVFDFTRAVPVIQSPGAAFVQDRCVDLRTRSCDHDQHWVGMLWFGMFTGQMDVMDFVYAQAVGYFLTALIALAAVFS